MIEQPFKDLVAALAAKSPTPGGGAAAAMSACLGASLFVMVIRFSRGKKATLDHDSQLAAVEDQLLSLLSDLEPMAGRDCSSFDAVSAAYKLPKESEAEQEARNQAIEAGMLGAMVVPAATLASIRDVLKTVVPVLALVGRNIASDLGSGTEMLVAGAEGAFLNVRINAAYLKDRATAESALEQNGAILAEVRDIQSSIRETVETMLT